MSLSELDVARINRLLSAFCDRVPEHLRDRLRHAFKISGNTVELYEVRPHFQHREQLLELPVAKFTYVATKKVWRLFCKHRDLKWHRYEPCPEARSFEALLDEVQTDPTHIFWG